MNNIKKHLHLLFSDNWKETGLATLFFIGALIVIDSVLFNLAVVLLKIALTLAILGMLGKTAFLLYPILKKKAEER
jgi:hypothetical protein